MSYSVIKAKLISVEPNQKELVEKVLEIHKRLKELNRLKPEDIDIDKLSSNCSHQVSFLNKYISKKYSIDIDVLSRDELLAKIKIISENEDWKVFYISTPEEAYLFHGLASWCIISGEKDRAKTYFKQYCDNAHTLFIQNKKVENSGGNDYFLAFILGSRNKIYDKKDNCVARGLDEAIKYLNRIKVPKFNIMDLGIKVPSYFIKNDDGTYNVGRGGINDPMQLKPVVFEGKIQIKLKKCDGPFNCSGLQLSTLENCPKEINGVFNCSKNKLTSLNGVPSIGVTEINACANLLDTLEINYELNPKNESPLLHFFIEDNVNIKSFSGIDKYKLTKKSKIYATRCTIETLDGLPDEIDSLDVSGNHLVDLKGCPQKIKSLNVSLNWSLKSFNGAPEKCSIFKSTGNPEIKNIKYLPITSTLVDLDGCGLKSIEGFPKKTHGKIVLNDNKIESLSPLVGLSNYSISIRNNPIKSIVGIPWDECGVKLVEYDKFWSSIYKDKDGKIGYRGNINEDIVKTLLDKNNEISFKIDIIRGDFSCRGLGIKSFKNFPEHIIGELNCSNNNIKKFDGCPNRIDGNFVCSNNQIKDSPKSKIDCSGGFFYEGGNKIKDFTNINCRYFIVSKSNISDIRKLDKDNRSYILFNLDEYKKKELLRRFAYILNF